MMAKRCSDCILYHPERVKVCSVFGRQENRNGDCSAYIAAWPDGLEADDDKEEH